MPSIDYVGTLAWWHRAALPGALLVGALGLQACGSTPPVAPALATGSASFEAARAAGAAELSPVELESARTKLERARAAARAGDERRAVVLAEQADVDAQLARARASSERSRRAVAETEAALRTLREELSRPPPATAAPVRP